MNRESFDPTKMKITDIRTAVVDSYFESYFTYPLIRIDTNQGIHGLGEIWISGHEESALLFKSLLLGKNPTNIDELFRLMKPYVARRDATEAGGISGIEIALWDIIGKTYGVPLYQFLGGKYRDKIRIYADTPSPKDPSPQGCAEAVLKRKKMGLTFIKFDLGIRLLQENNVPNALIGNQLTNKGIEYLVSCVDIVRETVGYEIPLALDHFGQLSVKDCIRLGKALEQFSPAWLEDMRPWWDIEGNRLITRAIDTPTLNGEVIFALEPHFKEIIDKRAVDIIHPDLCVVGGIRETKRVADYADETSNIPTALHYCGSPIGYMACVHAAAAIRDFVALENHSLDNPWWKDLVTGLPDPYLKDGYVDVPEKPGLGVDLNEEVIKEHLLYPGYFEPTYEWDRVRRGFYEPRSGHEIRHARKLALTAGATGEVIELIAKKMIKEKEMSVKRARELLSGY